jgi:hypothetical protein
LGALLCISVAACGDGSGAGDDGGGGTGGLVGPMGCLVQDFRGEPDILVFPLPPQQLTPGSTVEFSIFVDADTRLVKATLLDAWRLRDPPQGKSETFIVPTTGNKTLDFAIPMSRTGRYYVDLELCGSDCDQLRVVYTLNRANAGPESDAINDPYERIVYEGDVETGSSFTCDKPRSVAIQS